MLDLMSMLSDIVASSMPANWTTHWDDNGHEYFYNSVTQVSQWERPTQ